MTISANERWTQRIMGGLGARPVGHTAPADDEGPQVPVTSPVPAAQPVPPPRITDWWRTGRPSIGPHNWVKPDEDGDQADTSATETVDGEDQGDEPDEEKPAAAGPVPSGPVDKVATDSRGRAIQRKTSVRTKAGKVAGDSRMRIVAFNLSAALVGKGLGLVDLIAAYMPVAEKAAVGTFGFVLAAVGAWGAWKITGAAAVRAVFADRAVFVRLAVTAGAAGIGHQLAPVPVAYLNQYGEEWGLGPSTISLLITAGGICFVFWWFIDRHTRRWHWLTRWMFRIPLASALLACVPYAGTPVV